MTNSAAFPHFDIQDLLSNMSFDADDQSADFARRSTPALGVMRKRP